MVGLKVEEKTWATVHHSDWEWVIRDLVGGSWAEGIVSKDQELIPKGIK